MDSGDAAEGQSVQASDHATELDLSVKEADRANEGHKEGEDNPIAANEKDAVAIEMTSVVAESLTAEVIAGVAEKVNCIIKGASDDTNDTSTLQKREKVGNEADEKQAGSEETAAKPQKDWSSNADETNDWQAPSETKSDAQSGVVQQIKNLCDGAREKDIVGADDDFESSRLQREAERIEVVDQKQSDMDCMNGKTSGEVNEEDKSNGINSCLENVENLDEKTKAVEEVGGASEMRPATVVTLTSNISEADFDYDFIKPYENDSDEEISDGGRMKVEERRKVEKDVSEIERVVFSGAEDDCLIDLKEDSRNITVENNKQEINATKATKLFEEEYDDDDDDDDDILVFDKPPSAVSEMVRTQSAEVVLEGIAEEPEDLRDEEADPVLLRTDAADEELSKPGDQLAIDDKNTYAVRRKEFEGCEDGEGDGSDLETLNENLESKIKREEESLEKFQLQEQQIEEQVEREQQQRQQEQQQQEEQQQQNAEQQQQQNAEQQQQQQKEQQQQEQQQPQKVEQKKPQKQPENIEHQAQNQSDYHEYVNVKQFSPKLQTALFNDELPNDSEKLICNGTSALKETSTETPTETSTETFTMPPIETSTETSNGALEKVVEQEANRAVLSEEDFNFEMEKDDCGVVNGLKNGVEKKGTEASAQARLENNKAAVNKNEIVIGEVEDNLENVESMAITIKEEIGESSLGELIGKTEVFANKEKKVGVVGDVGVVGGVFRKDLRESEDDEGFHKVGDAEKSMLAKDIPPTSSTTVSTESNRPPSFKTFSRTPLSTTSTPTTPPLSRIRVTPRTPTTPGTPNASSSIRYNDILPEVGCVKALVERWSRLDGKDEKGMNRSRSCGPISRKLKLMSPERELEEDHLMGGSVTGRFAKKDAEMHYNSQPSLTRTMLSRFEKLDQEAGKDAKKKKEFKWQVKEANILKRPTYLPH